MTWLNGSISKRVIRVFGLTLGGVSVLLAAGCASRPPIVGLSSRQGSVRLDTLVKAHPGWTGIGQYDAAIARLHTAALLGSKTQSADASLVTLPEIAAVVPLVPGRAVARERVSLETQERAQVDRLAARLAMARQRQIDRQLQDWEHAADLVYRKTADLTLASYDAQFDRLYAENAAARINLTLQIEALNKLILHWALSIPPAPILEDLRKQLGEKQTALVALANTRDTQIARLQSERDDALEAALEARSASVSAQAADEQRRLEATDAQKIASERKRLSTQLDALLRETEAFRGANVASMGSLSQMTLPPGALVPSVALSKERLAAATVKLTQDRALWLDYVYADTKAAALDAAASQHWAVTFGPPRVGETDLTPQMATLLKAQVWKDE